MEHLEDPGCCNAVLVQLLPYSAGIGLDSSWSAILMFRIIAFPGCVGFWSAMVNIWGRGGGDEASFKPSGKAHTGRGLSLAPFQFEKVAMA